ncbi:cytochrome b5 reductase [Penicillium waksmanii]|uniref:cytochrome b5 reductase n=1 Tax=Penicillium waksmanii TaxID=69791 RepID=UPI002549AC18|nr:cytochrome b5 reductase [Penicillium waksmanii]KAJ5995205.1 cytochrome b5 reductase [Penicillium waksmanii]
MVSLTEYTANDVALHKAKNDIWVIIHGKVYNITNYVRDHPGGADVLRDVAGTDATEAYEDVGHSEDADEILASYLIGTLKGAREFTRPKAIRVVQQPPEQISVAKNSTFSTGAIVTTVGSVGGMAFLAFLHTRGHLPISDFRAQLLRLVPNFAHASLTSKINLGESGFSHGFISAGGLFTTIGVVIGTKLSGLTQIQSGFTRYPSHRKSKKMAKADPHLVKGFLDPKEYQELPLTAKEKLSPNVYRFAFTLPRPKEIIGLPIGQHVAIKATIDGQSVSRSYTPTSNNMDAGVLELVIKCYPDGLLTGKYLANLEVGDKVLFRGPKGAMKYQKGLCSRIGMIAGGTGITPMYQLIRAICEDDADTTEVSLVYANRSEEDILLRDELEKFARRYPKNLKLWYMLDHPPQNWKYGKGYVTPAIMSNRLPAPSSETKIMLCGPPGMVNASKKALCSLGFEAPGAVPKITDQIFCF